MEDIISFEALYESMQKCKKGVIWKDSVAHFVLNAVEEINKLETQLKNGTYKTRPTQVFIVDGPRKREAMGVAFRDRVYQRSLNDKAIYPALTRTFIYDNGACQKHKGTDFSRRRLVCFLQKFYRQHGTKGYVLQCDIKGYYPNMQHSVAEAVFEKHLPPDVFQAARTVLRDQYGDGVGYYPGSQMIQLAGISVLNDLDHFIKERLHIKFYIRYMDDFILIHHDKEYLEYCKEEIRKKLEAIQFTLHPKKTRIYPLTDGIKFLGFYHTLTDTGKVLRHIDPKNVKAERKKLRRLVNLAKKGYISEEKVAECYRSWRDHARKGDSHNLLQRMDTFYKDLWC